MLPEGMIQRLEGIETRPFSLEAFDEVFPPAVASALFAEARESLRRLGVDEPGPENARCRFVQGPTDSIHATVEAEDYAGRRQAWFNMWPKRPMPPATQHLFGDVDLLRDGGFLP